MRKLKTIMREYKLRTITDGHGAKTYDVKHKDENRKQGYGKYTTRYAAERELVFKAYGDFMEQFSAKQRAVGNAAITEGSKLFDSIYYKERYENA